MIQCLDKTQIDLNKWDSCLASSQSPMPYGSSWFLNCICKSWVGLVLDDYKAVMPLVTSRKFAQSYIMQAPFFQRTSIYSPLPLNSNIVASFYEAIPKKYKFHEFSVANNSLPPAQFAYEVRQKPNLILHLNESYDKIKRNYNSNTKRNLKKSLYFNLTLSETHNPSPMIEAYVANRGQTNKLKKSEIKQLTHVIDYSVKHKYGHLLAAHTEDKRFAGGIFILSAFHRHILLFMGANPLAKESGALTAMIDHYLQQHAMRKDIFDFEGSEDAGVARFYKGFGAKYENYYSLRRNDLNKLISFAKYLKG